MAFFVIPTDHCAALQQQLYDDYQVEAPTIRWNNRKLLRISVNAYNSAQELEDLIQALSEIVAG